MGPWKFVERVPQDRIVLEKSEHYFDPGQAKFDRIVFRIIADDNVRLANLRSGDIDMMHLVAPTDAASLKKEGRFDLSSVTGLHYNEHHHQPPQQERKESRRRSTWERRWPTIRACARRSILASTARR